MTACSNYGFNFDKDADGIVTITLDMDGPVNAMNADFRAGLPQAVDKLEQETGLSGVVIASAKKTFIAGGDIKELLSAEPGEEDKWFQRVERMKGSLRRLERLKVPVVAAINGAALGGGLEICLACNHRIAWNHPKAVIGFPEVTLGLLPGAGGVVRSIHMLGLEKALPHLLEGSPLSPEQAKAAGFVNQLVDDFDDLLPTAKAWIKANSDSWAQPWDVKGHKIPGGDVWSPDVVRVLTMAPPQLYRKTRGLLPAPESILSVAGETVATGFDTALRIETRGLASLLTTPEAKNIMTSTFIQMRKIKSGANRPNGFDTTPFKKVGVLGAGMMGQGIAYATAAAGINVVQKDVSAEAAEQGKAYAEKVLNKLIEKGRSSEADKKAILARIKATDDYADLKGCDLIIETVFENIDLKKQVTNEAKSMLANGGIFASNTSTLPITQLAEMSDQPENFVGIHFFSPVERMPLIEIISGDMTSDETIAKAYDFARQLRKTPIIVNDSLGFFTSRVFVTYMDEGARLLVDGVDPIVIDAMGKQVGMPVGPLTVQDEVSQELTRKVTATHREMGVFGTKGDTRVGAEICERLIGEFGRGGRHYGGGYYEYKDDGTKVIWPKLYDLYHKPEVQMPVQDIKDRILFRQVNESLNCVEDGVLRSIAEGNVGSLLGIGAPAWTGGFIQFVNSYGLAAYAARCDELAKRYGERFKAPAIIAQKIKEGQFFH